MNTQIVVQRKVLECAAQMLDDACHERTDCALRHLKRGNF